jgi:sugar fermentation stimulation protein A
VINLNPKILKGFFLKRLNRFLAQIELEGNLVLAHVPNPGRMYELLEPRKEVYLKTKSGPQRKTDYDLIAVRHNHITISIDSYLPNRFTRRLLENHELPMFSEYDQVIPEPRVYDGRFDFKLVRNNQIQFIEVKSCTLVESGRALFPDAPTVRGARHVMHLAKVLKEKHVVKAAIMFVIQRPDANVFSPNSETDPDFTLALGYAEEQGVDIIPLTTNLVDWNLEFKQHIPYDLYYSPMID